MIKIRKIAEFVGCSGCRRGTLHPVRTSLVYPYDHSYELEVSDGQFGTVVRLCPDCMKELAAESYAVTVGEMAEQAGKEGEGK